jgi:hypothetical protein
MRDYMQGTGYAGRLIVTRKYVIQTGLLKFSNGFGLVNEFTGHSQPVTPTDILAELHRTLL